MEDRSLGAASGSVVDGLTRWLPPRDVSPLSRQALSALLGLGMSNLQIARYLRLEERHIAALRRAYGL